ncbi:MAG: NAD(P)/FAD-dependent oxidoreductase [Lachnospiraceae bacterium]|nr:NAD(P)/FAD-dependent oxidoreductase [Lachnospiraceae bacterium]
MDKQICDVLIIGGGVVGCSIARELSKYHCNIILVEKEEDVCSGTSKANSGIVHAGYDAKPGSLKAEFNVKGNARMEELSKELDFEFKRNASMVLCFDLVDLPALEALLERGRANGVSDLSILSGDEVRRLEPNVTDEVIAALYAPTGGIVCPFGLTIAMAENACDNGVKFYFNTEVLAIEKTNDGYIAETNCGTYVTKYIVNAAGVYADKIHNMVSEVKLNIIPRRGEYLLLEKEAGKHVSSTVFQLPGKYGKGVLVTPTVHGNLLIGPTAMDQTDKDLTITTAEGYDEICVKAEKSVKDIPFRQVITSFSGLRSHESGNDFVLGEPKDAEGFFDAAGIESPGLTCAPALGKYLAEMVAKKGRFEENTDFNPRRKGITRVADLSMEEKRKLIQERPEYGTIVCRCENISEGEIVDAITRTLGARSLDGIKRRVRQGMGRCQAGFCTPRTVNILARETGIPLERICKNGTGSELLKEEGYEYDLS